MLLLLTPSFPSPPPPHFTPNQNRSRLTNSNNAYQKQLVQLETQAKLDDSSVVPLQFQVHRLETELDSLQSHSKWLEEELRTKTEESASVKKKSSIELSQLRAKADAATLEKEQLATEATHLREQLTHFLKKTESLSKEALEARQEMIDTKAGLEEELLASRQLSDLQKEQLLRLQARHDDMAKQMESLKALAREAENETNSRWKEQETAIQEASKQALEKQADEYEQKLAALKEKLSDAERRYTQAEDGILNLTDPSSARSRSNAPLRITGGPSADAASGDGDTDGEEEPISLTELYSRLAQTEDDLNRESLLRKQSEIKLKRVEAEVLAVAPALQRQKKQYEMAMERQIEFQKRMEAALDETAVARNESKMLEMELNRLRKKNKDLDNESKVLAEQVQQMLVSRSVDGAETMNPTVPLTVANMHKANTQLLTQYKAMEEKIKELEAKLQNDDLNLELEAYKREMERLREERQIQATKVENIVQQRDLYKAILNSQDSNMLVDSADESNALALVKIQSEKTKALEAEKRTISMELSKAQAQIDGMKRETEIAVERVSRYEVLNKDLMERTARLENCRRARQRRLAAKWMRTTTKKKLLV
jgi:nucleoprotein TPR